eukprot:5299326-Pleurochrysis_carterae.AAC.2
MLVLPLDQALVALAIMQLTFCRSKNPTWELSVLAVVVLLPLTQLLRPICCGILRRAVLL